MGVEAGEVVPAKEVVVPAKVFPFSDCSLYLGTKTTTRRMGQRVNSNSTIIGTNIRG